MKRRQVKKMSIKLTFFEISCGILGIRTIAHAVATMKFSYLDGLLSIVVSLVQSFSNVYDGYAP